jgi:hypothetical protein
MLKKLIAHTILLSMVLHCSFRLGLIDHLYQQRHDIVLALGLIKEKPIAMCSSDYDSSEGLQIKTDNNSHSLPSVIQAREINLFFVTEYTLPRPEPVLLSDRSFANAIDLYCFSPFTSVFHPPSA